jgi:oxalate decarboxylase/phosphoglucose isomerase-like protein (cupin superfamily)
VPAWAPALANPRTPPTARRPGTVLYVPREVPHSYSNLGAGPARILLMYSPAGMVGMFAEIAAV